MLDIKDVYVPSTLSDALDYLSNHKNTAILAGGTDLVVHLRHAVNTALTLVSIADIKALKGIVEQDNGDIKIGATTTFTELIESECINKRIPALAKAALTVAGPQIRNTATLGGNIANGAVSADSVPCLLVYDASLHIISSQSQRIVKLKDFFIGPGKVVLKEDEILSAIIIPNQALSSLNAHYIKYATRKAMDLAVLGVALGIAYNAKQEVTDFKLAMGVAAPTPIRIERAEAYALNKVLDDKTVEEIIKIALEDTSIRESWRGSKLYRSHITGVLIKEAIQEINTVCMKEGV